MEFLLIQSLNFINFKMNQMKDDIKLSIILLETNKSFIGGVIDKNLFDSIKFFVSV